MSGTGVSDNDVILGADTNTPHPTPPTHKQTHTHTEPNYVRSQFLAFWKGNHAKINEHKATVKNKLTIFYTK